MLFEVVGKIWRGLDAKKGPSMCLIENPPPLILKLNPDGFVRKLPANPTQAALMGTFRGSLRIAHIRD